MADIKTGSKVQVPALADGATKFAYCMQVERMSTRADGQLTLHGFRVREDGSILRRDRSRIRCIAIVTAEECRVLGS